MKVGGGGGGGYSAFIRSADLDLFFRWRCGSNCAYFFIRVTVFLFLGISMETLFLVHLFVQKEK